MSSQGTAPSLMGGNFPVGLEVLSSLAVTVLQRAHQQAGAVAGPALPPCPDVTGGGTHRACI